MPGMQNSPHTDAELKALALDAVLRAAEKAGATIRATNIVAEAKIIYEWLSNAATQKT